MKTRTKWISVILALVFAVSATLTALAASSTNSKRHPPEVLLDTIVDAYAEAKEEDPDLGLAEWHWSALNDYLSEASEKKESLPVAFAKADDLTKAQMILWEFYGGYGFGGDYSFFFWNGADDLLPGLKKLAKVTGSDVDVSGYEKIFKEPGWFSYTPSFKEYLTIMKDYIGSGKEDKSIKVVEWDKEKYTGPGWSIGEDAKVGDSFYDIYDSMFQDKDSGEPIYACFLSGFLGIQVSKQEYVTFLQEVYDYMYPSASKDGHFAAKKGLSNITKVTDVSATDVTSVGTDITKVSYPTTQS